MPKGMPKTKIDMAAIEVVEKAHDAALKGLSVKKSAPETEEEVAPDTIDEKPKEWIVHYRGHIHKAKGTNPVFSRVVPDVTYGGLLNCIFDRVYQGIPNCAIVPDPNIRALVWIDVVPNPRNPKKRLLRPNRDLVLLEPGQIKELRDRRLALVRANQVPDWAFEGPDGEEII